MPGRHFRQGEVLAPIVGLYQFIRRNIYTTSAITKVVRDAYNWWTGVERQPARHFNWKRAQNIAVRYKDMAYRRKGAYRKRRAPRRRVTRKRRGTASRRWGRKNISAGGTANRYRKGVNNQRGQAATPKGVIKVKGIRLMTRSASDSTGGMDCNVKLNDCGNISISTMQKMFNEYRITKCYYNFLFIAGDELNSKQYGGNCRLASQISKVGEMDARTWAQMAKSTESNVRIMKPGQTIKLAFVPAVESMIQKNAKKYVSAMTEKSPWLDLDYPEIEHMGMKIATAGMSGTDSLSVSMMCDVEFGNPKQGMWTV